MKFTGWKTCVGALALASLLCQACYAAKINTIAILTPEPGTDYGWNQQGINAAREAGKKEGVKVLVADNLGYGDVRPALRDLADDGAQVFIAHVSGLITRRRRKLALRPAYRSPLPIAPPR